MNLLMSVAILAGLLVLLQVLLSIRTSNETRRVYAYLLDDARRRSRRSFSAVVELGRKAETIYPLLDHLRSLDYDKLQVIVLVKQTAGSRAVPELRTYRRRNKMLGLRIVQYKKGTTPQVLANRYATGEYVMTMQPGERLNSRFFIAASQILVTTKAEALAVREVVHPAHSFKHAFWALTSLVRATRQSLLAASSVSSRTITARQTLKKNEDVKPISYLSDQFYISLPRETAAPRPTLAGLLSVLVIGALVVGGYILATFLTDMTTARIYGVLFVLLPVVAGVIAMMSVKGYTFLDYLNMILFIPLAPFYALAYGLIRFIRLLSGAERRKLSARRLPR